MCFILSLGSLHDGISDTNYSPCLPDNGNIMNSILKQFLQYNSTLGLFSSCSINAFKRTLLNSNLEYIIYFFNFNF